MKTPTVASAPLPAALLLVALCLGLAACGNKGSLVRPSDIPPPPPAQDDGG
jgi:predicted small lipoprotein YifL